MSGCADFFTISILSARTSSLHRTASQQRISRSDSSLVKPLHQSHSQPARPLVNQILRDVVLIGDLLAALGTDDVLVDDHAVFPVAANIGKQAVNDRALFA